MIGRARWPFARPTPPADIRALVPLAPRERILGWGRSSADGWVVATDDALIAGSDAGGAVLRVQWVNVRQARWAEGSLEIVGRADDAASVDRHVLSVDEAGLLAEAVRAKVTESVLLTTRIERDEHCGAHVAATRAADGSVAWTVVADRGVDASDPAFRAWADAEIAHLKQQTGLA